MNKISSEVRSWRLHTRTGLSEADLARRINPVVRGWMNYYGAFYPSALYPLLARINAYLLRWLRKKHKRLRGRRKAQNASWSQGINATPRLDPVGFWAEVAEWIGSRTRRDGGSPSCWPRVRRCGGCIGRSTGRGMPSGVR
jgi:hypothetical protein